jgi:hypothetical protein
MLRLMDKPQDTPKLPARYYRQKAVEARQAAEEATTRDAGNDAAAARAGANWLPDRGVALLQGGLEV